MADFSKLSPDNGGTILNCKDATARTGVNNAFKVMGEMGAKNLLDNTATTTTTYGVTYTVNSDKSVTPSNTASGGNAQLKILNNTTGAKLKAMWGSNKDVIMTGCPSGGASNKYFLRLQKVLPSWAAIKDDYGDGISFNTSILEDESTYQVVISINDGYSVNSSFYPMIRLASDTDSTYQPYAMTNKELTDAVNPIGTFETTYTSIATTTTANAWTHLASFILPKGKWLISVCGRIKNGTANTIKSLAIGVSNTDSIRAVSSFQADTGIMNLTMPFNNTSEQIVYVNAYTTEALPIDALTIDRIRIK